MNTVIHYEHVCLRACSGKLSIHHLYADEHSLRKRAHPESIIPTDSNKHLHQSLQFRSKGTCRGTCHIFVVEESWRRC